MKHRKRLRSLFDLTKLASFVQKEKKRYGRRQGNIAMQQFYFNEQMGQIEHVYLLMLGIIFVSLCDRYIDPT